MLEQVETDCGNVTVETFKELYDGVVDDDNRIMDLVKCDGELHVRFESGFYFTLQQLRELREDGWFVNYAKHNAHLRISVKIDEAPEKLFEEESSLTDEYDK